MAAAFALLAGILPPCWSASAKFTKGSVKVSQSDWSSTRVQAGISPSSRKAAVRFGDKSSEGEWVECCHHSECFSDCCLMNLDAKAAFCAPKTRINKVCLPQTKGAINILCPCQMVLSCHSKDVILCPRGCYLI